MRGSQAKAPPGPSAERMVGPRVGAGAPHRQAMERMESGKQPWTVRAAGEPGPPGVQEGAWRTPEGGLWLWPRDRAAPDVPQPRFPGLASPGIKLSLSPHPVLSGGFLLARHAEKLDLRGPLKRPHGSECRGRKGMGGPGSGGDANWLAAQALLHSPRQAA